MCVSCRLWPCIILCAGSGWPVVNSDCWKSEVTIRQKCTKYTILTHELYHYGNSPHRFVRACLSWKKCNKTKKKEKKKSPWQPSKEERSLWWIEPFSWFWFGLPHFAAWAGQWTCTKNDNHTCYTHIKHHPYRHFELKWCLMKYNYEIGLIIKNKQQSNITNM